MKGTLAFVLAGLAVFGTAEVEVFDLGKLDQYKPKQKQNPPSLTGNSVWLSGTEEHGGFDFGMSPDIKAKVQGVIEGCGKLDDKCYQQARAIIRSADLEVDHKLERRHFGHFLLKTAKGSWAMFADIATNLYMSWQLKSHDLDGAESFMFIPVSKAGEAAKLETATNVVVSGDGKAIATITPKPDPTSIKGSHAPSVTAVTSAHDGLSKGDLVVSLDQNLASQMQELMMRTTLCEDGDKFNREHPSRRRANGRLGRVICAYQAVIVNMGGALSDLLQTNLGGMNLDTPASPPDTAAAAGLAQQFTEDYAPLISLPLDRSRAMTAYLFSLAMIVVLERQPLGPDNKIPSTMVQTDAPKNTPTQTTASKTSSSSGCPDPTKTPLFCGRQNDNENNCQVVMPKTGKDEPKCAEASTNSAHLKPAISKTRQDGDYRNCPCNTPTDMIIQWASGTELKAMNMFGELFDKFPAQPELEPSPSPNPEPLKEPTKSLGILAEYMTGLTSLNDLANFNRVYWNFFATDYGEKVGCRQDPIRSDMRDVDRSKQDVVYPGGEFPLELFGEKCTYKNSGDNVGKLFCGDKAIECLWDPDNKSLGSPEEIKNMYFPCGENRERHYVFYCPF